MSACAAARGAQSLVVSELSSASMSDRNSIHVQQSALPVDWLFASASNRLHKAAWLSLLEAVQGTRSGVAILQCLPVTWEGSPILTKTDNIYRKNDFAHACRQRRHLKVNDKYPRR